MNPSKFLQEDFPALLNELKSEDKAVWGIMGPQHMVEHLSGIVMISNGRFEAPPMYEQDKLERNYNYIIKNQNRIKRNTKAPILPDNPLPLRFESLAAAKEKLLKSLDTFFEYHDKNKGLKIMHPAFGKLNFEEWAFFHAIHCQYHLDQFGLYEGGAAV